MILGDMWRYGSTAVGKGGWINSAVRSGWASPIGRRAMMGAGIGAAYGMFSNNTSIKGGAFMGAAIGAYAPMAWQDYQTMRKMNLQFGYSAGKSLTTMWHRGPRRHFGMAWNRVRTEGINAFTALGL